MEPPKDPHEMDLAQLFPSLSEAQRESVRIFLDKYCGVALKVFERLEEEGREEIDPREELRYL